MPWTDRCRGCIASLVAIALIASSSADALAVAARDAQTVAARDSMETRFALSRSDLLLTLAYDLAIAGASVEPSTVA